MWRYVDYTTYLVYTSNKQYYNHCFSYEGTGRSLSLKLIQQLRQQSSTFGGTSAELKKTVSMAPKSDSVSSSSGMHIFFFFFFLYICTDGISIIFGSLS